MQGRVSSDCMVPRVRACNRKKIIRIGVQEPNPFKVVLGRRRPEATQDNIKDWAFGVVELDVPLPWAPKQTWELKAFLVSVRGGPRISPRSNYPNYIVLPVTLESGGKTGKVN